MDLQVNMTTATKCLFFSFLLISSLLWAEFPDKPRQTPEFDSDSDVVSLHYDHAPDKDDGQSAAADRTILESMFSTDWIRKHTIAVSGAYGKNKHDFNPKSDEVMKAVWDDCCGWLSAHTERDSTVMELTLRWSRTLETGGNIWVKEGGQSDLTAMVAKRIKKRFPGLDTTKRIRVVQHSDWNERQTTEEAFDYVRNHTLYIKIRDANAYLNIKGGNDAFVKAATTHPVFAGYWRAAFSYYDPKERLDFSDTGELMYILSLGEIGIEQFSERFLVHNKQKTDDGK